MNTVRTLAVMSLLTSTTVLSQESQNVWAFECGSTFNSQTSFESLVQMFGANNVIEAELHENEGSYELGTLIFPGSQNEVQVFWHDPLTRQSLRKVRISGSRSSWKVRNGLALGLDLKSIESINRKPFRLAGFGFDYSGTVTSWENGDLEVPQDKACRLVVRFDADFSKVPFELIRENGHVMGSRIFSSGHPTMQLLNPTVRQLTLFIE